MAALVRVTIAFLLSICFFSFSHAQQQQPQGRDKDQFQPLAPGSPLFQRRKRINCDLNFRTIDGTCTNPRGGRRKLYGSTNRGQRSYFFFLSTDKKKGDDLKSAREISNILFQSSSDVYDPRGLNEMATFFGQFIDHNLVATPSDKNAPCPIPIPDDDPVFGNATFCGKAINKPSSGKLPFFRSMRVPTGFGRRERPQNSLTSAVDLDAVYGPSEERNNALRTKTDGLMKVSAGDLPPFNTGGFNNAPDSKSSSFFFTGDHRANEHPVLTSLHTLFLREHNSLAAELKAAYPYWDDNRLFLTARKINIAQFQKIVFYDWLPSVTGFQLPRFRRFKSRFDLTISVEFSTAAFRVGHTMVGNGVSRRGPGNTVLPSIAFCNMFFNMVGTFQKPGALESFVLGALRNRAQKVDLEVRDSLRNFLFENVNGEDGFDLVALNIQRGRDHALPTYNEIRRRFGIAPAKSFSGITSNAAVQSKLMNAYGTVDKVEAWPGMLAEDLKAGSSLPPLILRIWQSEFLRLRDGDFFFYLNRRRFDGDLITDIPRVRELFDIRVDTYKAIILRHTGIAPGDLPKKMFFWN